MIHLFIVGILVIISTYFIGTALTTSDILPAQSSLQAQSIDYLFGIHMWLFAFFFSLIVVFLVYSLVVFRRKKGEEGDGAHFEGNTKLEIVWTVVPLGIVIFLAVVGAQVLGDVERRAPDAIEVNVIGEAPIAEIAVIRNNVTTHTHVGSSTAERLSYVDTEALCEIPLITDPVGQRLVFYYVRVTQTDGEMAWSSPIWLLIGGEE